MSVSIPAYLARARYGRMPGTAALWLIALLMFLFPGGAALLAQTATDDDWRNQVRR